MMEVGFSMLHSEGSNSCISMMHGRREHASATADPPCTAVVAVLIIWAALRSGELFPKLPSLERHFIEGMAHCM